MCVYLINENRAPGHEMNHRILFGFNSLIIMIRRWTLKTFMRFVSPSRGRFQTRPVHAIIVLLIALFTTFPAQAEDESPWHIVADTLSYDKVSGITTAEGDVVVTHQDKTLTSQFLEYDNQGESVFARGNVEMKSRGDSSKADRMLLNLKKDTGVLYNGSVFMETNHVYIKGSEIRKIDENTYTADKVSITTCDGDNPDWKFTGHDLSMTIEGYGTIYNAAFWTKKLPVLYSPFLVFPVKIKRQTGLLAPEFGLSDRKGFEYLQPFFWAINESSDATINNRYIEKRGNMTGIEYRYMLSETSKGLLFFDYLKDKEIDDGTEDATEKWGYEDSPTRDNRNRYWFRMKQDQTFPGNAILKVDVDVVSDQDYLREFSDMKNGFDASKSNFLSNFGRDIEANDDAVRTNSLILTKNWSSYSLNASTLWYDNVVKRVDHLADSTLQYLPNVEFASSRRQIFSSPLYYDFVTEYDYLFRKDTNDNNRTGQRANLYPRVILPLRYKNWLSIENTAALRSTTWYIGNDTNTSDDLDGTHNRQIYDLSCDLSTNLYRIFNTGSEGVDRIRHAFTPKLTYKFTPEKDQNEYPYFDALDRISRVNTLTLSLTNTLTSRSKVIEDEEEKKKSDKPNPKKFSYRQFCRFKLEQVYDINEANENDPDLYLNHISSEPFRPLYGEIEFLPLDFMSFDADAKWSHEEQQLLEGNAAMSLKDNRGDLLRFEHRYTKDSVKYLRSYLLLNLTDKLSVYGLNERNLMEREDLRSSAGFIYTSQCWGVEVDYTHKPGDRRYALTFQLSGLGEFGAK